MPGHAIRLLIVDDDEDDYVIIRDLLSEIQHCKFKLEWASTYQSGLQAILQGDHDICLIDYRLGEQTGLELLREALRQGCLSPIILLTGRGDSQVDADAMESGASDYLVKGQIGSVLLERSIRYSIQHKKVELRLRKTADGLARSNRDLAQFAYVASHELKEPLSMVVSYLQLLEKRYLERLDLEAREFIGFAVGGASRMQALINDILAYSRISGTDKALDMIECERVLEVALQDLRGLVNESEAIVTHDPLPSVLAEESQLGHVFRNLVGNAIKFRGKDRPRVHIGVERQEGCWRFFVRDNGIGIDSRYAKNLFKLFQRLHGRNSYPGTGIGLAVAKKVIERHGGKIWFESQPGQGSTFYFTLPIQRKPQSADEDADVPGEDTEGALHSTAGQQRPVRVAEL